jgi:hypothetical protein
MPIVSVTRLRVRSWIYLPAFFLRSLLIARQVKSAPGNLAVKFLNDSRKTFWTCTSWESETAMKTFMLATPHGPAMRKLLEWCDEAALVHWSQPTPELPAWTEAHARMQREGRTSKVNHPSENHRQFVIAAPQVGARDNVRFK